MRRLLLLFCPLLISISADFVDIACDRNPNLPYCRRALGAKTTHAREPREEELTAHDKMACRELRQEYIDQCAKSATNGRGEKEFCQAFENICFRVHKNDPDQDTNGRTSRVETELEEIDAKEKEQQKKAKADAEDSSARDSDSLSDGRKKKKKRINFTEFCKEFKNRYLYVCPDPFRFGQKAVVFCPIYSEHCHVPLPDKPVLPTRKSKKRGGSVARMCASYRNFAEQYCNNALLLAQPKYRQGCEKYWRFCLKRG